jgi:ketohexokinase
MARILAVGIATLDIINQVNGYPAEDDEVRAVGQRLCRGGNATNTLTVLSQLGHRCHWAGVLADEPDARHIEADLARHHIDCDAVLRLDQGKVPTSYITHNLSNGSRTIVHYRDLPEYPFTRFRQIDLNQYDWLHFEGRNVAETKQMLEWARNHSSAPISIEIEKERKGIDELFDQADLLLFARPFAQGRGHTEAHSLLNTLRPRCGSARLVCAWGEAGAWGVDESGLHHSPAFPPATLVDTLGAGDTLNAGIIDALLRGLDLDAALESACRLAGRKCGVEGLDFL